MFKMKTKSGLFDGSDSDEEKDDDISKTFRVNKKYATAYDTWRQKEELQKLKDRHGDVSLAEKSDASSSEESDPFEGFTADDEKDFLKKLAIVKSGDYYNDKNVDDDTSDSEKQSKLSQKTKKKEYQQMYLKDYERRLILEREGRVSEDDDSSEDEFEHSKVKGKSYVQEQQEIKDSFKSALEMEDEDNEDDFLHIRQKTAEEKAKEEEEYLEWLKGQKESVSDEKTASDLKSLRDYWNDPKLDASEKFLRDYILNRKYMQGEEEDDSRIPAYEEIVGEDEVALEDDADELNRQEEFEHKYNFRYEEPDDEFIKTYPRTVADSLRRKDEKRKQQRDQYKQRKDEEKQKRVEEIKHLKNLKRQEIMDKLERLRRIAGTEGLALDVKALDDDFDPEKHDQLMKAAFGDGYYEAGDEGEEKPEFSDDDESTGNDDGEGEDLPNWDEWKGGNSQTGSDGETVEMEDTAGPSKRHKMEEMETKKKRKRSLLAEALTRKKPAFDPVEKKFEEYFDEYYKLDVEDILSDGTRCRFKYRQVEPNDFGLSVEEIISAKDKELNAWVTVKKMSQYRTNDEERYDQKAYQNRAQNVKKKQRLLQSVYEEKEEPRDVTKEPEHSKPAPVASKNANSAGKSTPNPVSKEESKKKRKRKRNKKKTKSDGELPERKEIPISTNTSDQKPKAAKSKWNSAQNVWDRKTTLVEKLSNERLAAYGVNPKKLKNRVKYGRHSAYNNGQ